MTYSTKQKTKNYLTLQTYINNGKEKIFMKISKIFRQLV